MKLVIHGKSINLTLKDMQICRTIATPNTKVVIDLISAEPKSASYLAKKSKMSLSNVYRILDVLKKYDLVKTSTSFDKLGRKMYLYQSLINTITLS